MPEASSPIARPDLFPASTRRVGLGVGVIAVGIVTSLAAFWAVRQAELARVRSEFVQRAEAAANFMMDGLSRHQDALYALRVLFHYSEDVDRTEFMGAARDLMSRQTGILALEWVERVPDARRASVEAAMRADGFPNFHFRERVSGNDLRTTGQRPEYFPVMFVEPMEGNERALGFDLQTGSTWPVLQKVAEVDTLTASGRLPLLTAGEKMDWGYIMELPVYNRSMPTTTPEERRAALRGFILGIFQIARTLESFFVNTPREEDILEILFLDRSASADRQFLHYHSRGWTGANAAIPPTAAAFASGIHLRVPMNHAGRQWELWFRPRGDWLNANAPTRSWLTLALGLVVTGAASSYVFGALRRERLVRRLVAERTAELQTMQAALERDNRERRETQRQLSSVISQLPGAAFRCRLDEKLTAEFASDGMFQLTGYAADDLISGRVHISDLTLDEDRVPARTAVVQAVEKRQTFEVGYRIRDRDGKVRHLLVRGRPIFADDGTLRFIEGLAIDVTALKAAEAEKLAFDRKLLETQKLESLGVLAGGIAHDFNNLLTAMLGNASLARYALPAGSQSAEHIEQIEHAARRAADLCQQMLAYAGRKELRAQATDVTELVRSTAALLRVSIHKNTRLDLRLAEALPMVHADAAQLQQIVMNLVINAADAIGDKAGEIMLTTYSRQADSEYLRTALHRPELPAGEYVGLEVKDNGCGMAAETLARIFEPFFTTKFSGRGLGLAAVLGIVQSHRGALFVESEPGAGSTFRLLLRAQSTPRPVRAAAEKPAETRLAGQVLVVDDEDYVREVLGMVLRQHGLKPLLAGSGQDALRIYAENGNAVTLVLLDLTMPGMSGEETLRALRERNRGQRVLVMSGYSAQESAVLSADPSRTDFLAKPFELPALLEKVKSLVE